MNEFTTIPELRSALKKERAVNKKIALVPTMGYFHDGHLELMRRAKRLAGICVVSIFINPAQFGPNEDLDRYPRDLERDRKLSNSVGVDYLFTPPVIEMYPRGYSTYVDVPSITNDLCGRNRPGHFRGVATIVGKLFNIVQPDIALFGEKDYQQLEVIRRMTSDLNMNIEIIGVPIVREPDGLAMSSRNSYLSAEERQAALSISRALILAQQMVDSGVIDSWQIAGRLKEFMETGPLAHLIYLEYLEVRDAETLAPVETVSPAGTLVAIAAKVGKTRLIDNSIIRVDR